LRKALDLVTDAAAMLSAVCVGLTAVAYVAEIVARYMLNSPLNWSADFGSYMLCAGVFLALPKVTADGAHPSISFAVDRLSGPAHARYTRVLILVTAAVVSMVCVFVAKEALLQFEQGTLTPTANQIPRWWLSAIAGFGLVFTVLNLLLRPRLAPEPGTPEI
jgi:TRAP-type C4-dicarboxylate transport system permease small subunit